MNYRVEIFDADGNFISQFGKHCDGPGCFAHPKGIAVDSDGHIWVADPMLDLLQAFNREGEILGIVGGHGEQLGTVLLPRRRLHRQEQSHLHLRAISRPGADVPLHHRRRSRPAKEREGSATRCSRSRESATRTGSAASSSSDATGRRRYQNRNCEIRRGGVHALTSASA